MKYDYENLFKRLLMLNQKGIYLYGRDGHVWIGTDENIEYPLNLNNVLMNTKIYGGVVEAFDTIDEALRRDGQDDLLTRWNEYGEDVLFLGRGGVDESRIDNVKSGQGGWN
jgi:hypothetical protein